MKILVTGATGFIGSHLVQRLLKDEENDIWTMERYVTGRIGGERKRFCDLRDSFFIIQLIQDLQPQIVVHLAARTPVALSYDTPQDYMENNLIGTINLAEACRLYCKDLQQLVFSSTSETYGDQPDFPIYENAIQMPNSPYSVAKVAAENYLQYMRVAYEFPATVIRPFNTFGRRDNRHYVVESIVTQMLQGKDLRLGTPETERDFLYVDDHVNAYLKVIGNRRAVGKTYNVCTGASTSINDLVNLIKEVMWKEFGLAWDQAVQWNSLPPRPWDIQKLQGSFSRINSDLGWSPAISLEEGLRRTIGWWRWRVNL